MFVRLAQYVGGRILTALLVVAVGLSGFWFYQHPEHIQTLWLVIRGCLLWIGFVLILPWSLFFLPRVAARSETNLAAAALLIVYLLIDALVALHLAGWSISGALHGAVLVLGFMMAGLYNYLVCDFLAEQSGDTV